MTKQMACVTRSCLRSDSNGFVAPITVVSPHDTSLTYWNHYFNILNILSQFWYFFFNSLNFVFQHFKCSFTTFPLLSQQHFLCDSLFELTISTSWMYHFSLKKVSIPCQMLIEIGLKNSWIKYINVLCKIGNALIIRTINETTTVWHFNKCINGKANLGLVPPFIGLHFSRSVAIIELFSANTNIGAPPLYLRLLPFPSSLARPSSPLTPSFLSTSLSPLHSPLAWKNFPIQGNSLLSVLVCMPNPHHSFSTFRIWVFERLIPRKD